MCLYAYNKMHVITALAGVAQWIECPPANQRLLVEFLVRAHAWVAGYVPSAGSTTGTYILMFLSLPSPLPKNK